MVREVCGLNIQFRGALGVAKWSGKQLRLVFFFF